MNTAPMPGAPLLETRASPWLAVAMVVAWTTGAAMSAAAGMWTALGGTAVVLGMMVLALDRAILRELRPAQRTVLGGLFAGVIMVLVTYLLFPFVVRLAPGIGRDTERLYQNVGASSHLLLSLALLPVVLGEELVWRGLVQDALARRFRPAAAAPIGALLYAVAQAPTGSPVLVLAALACGIVWGGLRATTRSLVAPIVAHILWDEIVLFNSPVIGS